MRITNVNMAAVKLGLERWYAAEIAALTEGMGQAGMMLLNDATMELPTTPMLTGFLRGSGSVFANGKLVGTSPDFGGGGSPATTDEKPSGKPGVFVRVGFNTVYAAALHEGRWATGPLAGVVITNWSEKGSGKGYLIRSLRAHRNEYIGTAVDYARQKLGM